MEFGVYLQNFLCDRIPLRAPSTMTTVDQDSSKFYREGFILSLYLEDGSVGLGEVSSRRFLLSIFTLNEDITLHGTSRHNVMPDVCKFFIFSLSLSLILNLLSFIFIIIAPPSHPSRSQKLIDHALLLLNRWHLLKSTEKTCLMLNSNSGLFFML